MLSVSAQLLANDWPLWIYSVKNYFYFHRFAEWLLDYVLIIIARFR